MAHTRMSQKKIVLRISLMAVFTALITVSTLVVRIPVPATGGYINIGDAMIFIVALSFGRAIGGIAGGLGSAIADMIGFPAFAPFTLIIKGFEGYIAGAIADGKSFKRDALGWAAASAVMVAGYFIVEAYIMRLGIAASMVEIPGNLFQVIFGGIIGIPISRLIRRRIMNFFRM